MRKLFLIIFVLFAIALGSISDAEQLLEKWQEEIIRQIDFQIANTPDDSNSRDPRDFSALRPYSAQYSFALYLCYYEELQQVRTIRDSTGWIVIGGAINQYSNGKISQTVYSMNANSTVTLTFDYVWNGDNIERLTQTFQNNDTIISRYREEYFYNADNKMTSYDRYSRESDGTMKLLHRGIFSYNASGQMIGKQEQFRRTEDSGWADDACYNYTYGQYGLCVYEISCNYHEYIERTTYSYTDGELFESIDQKVYRDSTVNLGKTVYDISENPCCSYQYFLWKNNSWSLRKRYSYQYNNENKPVEYVREIPDTLNTGLWIPDYRNFYYYNAVNNCESYVEGFHKRLKNYPNPFNPETNLNFTLQKASDVEISFYNTKGQKVDTIDGKFYEKGEHNVVWKADRFSSGVYFAVLKAGNKTQTRKLVLMK